MNALLFNATILTQSVLGLPLTNSHNTRAAKLTFHIPHGGALHGLAGYFEAVLYGNVGLSIHPQRMDKISKDMLSWFPLFFPFKVRNWITASCTHILSETRNPCSFQARASYKYQYGD